MADVFVPPTSHWLGPPPAGRYHHSCSNEEAEAEHSYPAGWIAVCFQRFSGFSRDSVIRSMLNAETEIGSSFY
jgi:hypothetical protein